MHYYLDAEVLYKRLCDGTLLRCLDETEAYNHSKTFAKGFIQHASGHMSTGQIQKSRCFWMTMERDCIKYVRKFHKCQVYNDKINAPPAPLFNLASP
jgi:hypothetical protein